MRVSRGFPSMIYDMNLIDVAWVAKTISEEVNHFVALHIHLFPFKTLVFSWGLIPRYCTNLVGPPPPAVLPTALCVTPSRSSSTNLSIYIEVVEDELRPIDPLLNMAGINYTYTNIFYDILL